MLPTAEYQISPNLSRGSKKQGLLPLLLVKHAVILYFFVGLNGFRCFFVFLRHKVSAAVRELLRGQNGKLLLQRLLVLQETMSMKFEKDL